MLNINELSFNLREWNSRDFKLIHHQTKKINELAHNAGNSSDKFNQICLKFIKLAQNSNMLDISNTIKKPIDVRAFSYLLSTNAQFSKKIQFNKHLLNAILFPRKCISLLSLQHFIRAFFIYFDNIGLKNEFKILSNFIKQQLELRNKMSKDSSIGIWREYSDDLFSIKGPEFIVKRAKNNSKDLEEVFNEFSLNGFSDGHFQQVCRFHYYLEVLKEITPGKNHKILKELVKSDVYNASGIHGRLLGHAILSIMIDRIKGNSITKSWQNVILSIAGDPRTPKSSHKYQKWWMLLGDNRIVKVRSWLSKFDLNLFLNALESYGIDSGKSDLQRMFPARKHFLEGLIEQGLISNSRLFLSNQAEYYIKNYYKKDELPRYANISGQTSMIYMQVGKIHIIEGSHSFKFWILPVLPKGGKLLDYTKTNYIPENLRFNNNYDWERMFGKRKSRWPIGITHNPSRFSWQAGVIEQLTKLGVNLSINKLFSKEDYKFFKMWHL